MPPDTTERGLEQAREIQNWQNGEGKRHALRSSVTVDLAAIMESGIRDWSEDRRTANNDPLTSSIEQCPLIERERLLEKREGSQTVSKLRGEAFVRDTLRRRGHDHSRNGDRAIGRVSRGNLVPLPLGLKPDADGTRIDERHDAPKKDFSLLLAESWRQFRGCYFVIRNFVMRMHVYGNFAD